MRRKQQHSLDDVQLVACAPLPRTLALDVDTSGPQPVVSTVTLLDPVIGALLTTLSDTNSDPSVKVNAGVNVACISPTVTTH